MIDEIKKKRGLAFLLVFLIIAPNQCFIIKRRDKSDVAVTTKVKNIFNIFVGVKLLYNGVLFSAL